MKQSEIAYICKRISQTIVLLTALAACIVALGLRDDWVSQQIRPAIALTDGWIRINADGTEEAVSGEFSIGTKDPVTFYRILPEHVDEDELLRIKCPYTTVDAYVDGEQIYHAGTAHLGRIETTLGNVFALIPLQASYAGKEIRITVEPRHSPFDVWIKDAAITTMALYSMERIRMALPYFGLSVLLFVIGTISFGIFALFKITNSVADSYLTKGFLYLGCFSVTMMAWIVSDYHIFGMLSGHMALSGMINYIAFMICPFLFAGILIHVFGNRIFYRLIYILSGVNFVVQMLLFFTGVIDLPDGLIVSQGITALPFIALVYFGILFAGRMIRQRTGFLLVPMAFSVVLALYGIYVYAMNRDWMLYAAFALLFFALTVAGYLLNMLFNALRHNIELQQMKKIAYFDQMTGLENRRGYDEYIKELTLNPAEHRALCTLMLDVNGLKKTNDTKGHQAGDELLIGTAKCIQEVFGEEQRCFRTGGDEFVVIAQMEPVFFRKKTQELKDLLRQWKGVNIDGISASIGVADRMENPSLSVKQLLDLADQRMYKNKHEYYASQLVTIQEQEMSRQEHSTRQSRIRDQFALTRYTMPIISKLAEVIPGGFFIYHEDDERELIYQSHKVLEIFGCETLEEFKELTGYTFRGMVHPDDFERVQASIDQQIDDEEGIGEDHVMYRIIRKDGEIRMIDDYGHFSHSSDYGDIYYVFINDITELKSNDD
ncbi:MAG: diguanylate cyclase [Lachnospiraceae bacterium]|nr:diguanylate cyclase [Lachnospiraceae bacterium]